MGALEGGALPTPHPCSFEAAPRAPDDRRRPRPARRYSFAATVCRLTLGKCATTKVPRLAMTSARSFERDSRGKGPIKEGVAFQGTHAEVPPPRAASVAAVGGQIRIQILSSEFFGSPPCLPSSYSTPITWAHMPLRRARGVASVCARPAMVARRRARAPAPRAASRRAGEASEEEGGGGGGSDREGAALATSSRAPACAPPAASPGSLAAPRSLARPRGSARRPAGGVAGLATNRSNRV